jgi:hypothetical protein
VFFTRIYLDENDGAPHVSSDELTEMVRPLVEIQRSTSGGTTTGQHNGGTAKINDTACKITPTVLLSTALAGGSSSKTAMVGRSRVDLTSAFPTLPTIFPGVAEIVSQMLRNRH